MVADHRGTWSPQRGRGETAWSSEPIGFLRWPGLALAVGAVPDYEGGVIHEGDSARVSWPGGRATLPGRVAWVRPPGPGNPYSTEVAVEVRYDRGPHQLPPSPIEITVMPTGPADSVFAAPMAGVVKIGAARVVFEPLGEGRYVAHYVLPGPEVHGFLVIRSGVDRRMPAVVNGLAPLIRALEDSLRRQR